MPSLFMTMDKCDSLRQRVVARNNIVQIGCRLATKIRDDILLLDWHTGLFVTWTCIASREQLATHNPLAMSSLRHSVIHTPPSIA